MLTTILEVMLDLLLPTSTDLRLETITTNDQMKTLTMEVTSTQAMPACPRCHLSATRIHSTYSRTLADLPWADVAVCLRLQVRKCFYRSAAYPQSIFTERVLTVALPWARRTVRLATAQRQVGLALGGAAGARLTTDLTMATGIDTLLQLVRRTPMAELPPLRAVGIDDWVRPVPSKQAFAWG